MMEIAVQSTGCDPLSGCTYANSTAACDDGDACTEGDICSEGTCVSGTEVSCDDGNPCTTDSCNIVAGCINTNNTDPCDDGDACTDADQCGGGTCNGGIVVDCSNGNPCTDDSCDPASGCVLTANSLPCDDGDACTDGDTCVAQACTSTEATDCDDGNSCTADSCDALLGCQYSNVTGGCDDGDACTQSDVCEDGLCVGSAPLPCDDDNVCTDDSCDPATGCVHTPNSVACDDGDACTEGEGCSEGVCGSGLIVPSCYPPGAICPLYGAPGETVTCALSLARETEETDLPTGLQFTMNYTGSDAQFSGFTDITCLGPGGTEPCVPLDIPPNNLSPTGHSMAVTPSDTGSWAGTGSVVISNLSSPTTGITEAVLDGDQVTGEAEFVTASFTLQTAIASDNPSYVTVEGVIAANAGADPMVTSISGGLIVVGNPVQDCTSVAGFCDDGIDCTVDSCNFATAECVFTPDATQCDDGLPCTVGSCDSEQGCVFTTVGGGCDDGDPAPRIPAMRMGRACLRPLRTEPLATTVCSVPWTLPVSRVLARRVRGIRVTTETTAQ